MSDFLFLAEELETILQEDAEYLHRKLQAPLNESEISAILSKRKINDSQLLQFFKWKNGIEYNVSEYTLLYDFSSEGVFLPLSYAVSTTESVEGYEFWENHFFPLVGNYSGDYLLYDLRISEPTYGMLFLYSKSLLSIDPMMTYYDSISSMFLTIIECFKAGAFQYNSNEGLLIDFDLMTEISKVRNPSSSYWQQR